MKEKGFTLIELLVVISIIGVLSSVILASVKTAKDRATVAGGLQYEANILHAQGDRTVVYWKFNDSGTSVTDSSGFGNTGTHGGAGMSYNLTDVPHTSKSRSLLFNGASYVTTPYNSLFALSTQGFTFMAWIKPSSLVGENNILSKNFSQLYLSNGNLTMRVHDNVITWIETTNGPAVPTTAWTHVAGVYSPDGYVRIYMNGKLVGTSALSGLAPTNYIDPVVAGARYTAGYTGYYTGLMDDAVFVNEAAASAAIEKHFAETKDSHLSVN